MKYDLTCFPVAANGKKFFDENKEDLNYKIILSGLCANGLDENGVPVKGKAKLKFYAIHLKIVNSADSVELSAEDVGLLSAAAINLPPVLAGQVIDFLDQGK